MVFSQDAARRIYRQLLAARGMTTKQVAELVGVVPATLYNWVKDTDPTKLGRGTLARIAEVFGVDVEQMIYHVPTASAYKTTKPEECFATEATAQAAGYRKALR